MKKITLIFIFLLTGLSGFAQKKVSDKQLKDSVIWREGYVLEAEDYKAKPKGKYAVQSAIGMYMYVKEKAGTLVFVVESIFLRSMSFLRTPSEYLLKHEQISFDLCEVHARKLRKKIATKKFSKSTNVKQELTNMYKLATAEYDRDRQKYERETEGGLNTAKQQIWADKLAKELGELSAYASTEVEIGQ